MDHWNQSWNRKYQNTNNSYNYVDEYEDEEDYYSRPVNWKVFGPVLIIFAVFMTVFMTISYNRAETYITYSRDSHLLKTLNIVNSKLSLNDPPLINYSYYGWSNSKTANCKDFSFAFAVLYGKGAQVVISDEHAFILMNSKTKIEPQQSSYNFNPNYRIKDTSYKIISRVNIREQDEQIIRRYFQ